MASDHDNPSPAPGKCSYSTASAAGEDAGEGFFPRALGLTVSQTGIVALLMVFSTRTRFDNCPLKPGRLVR